MLLLRPKPSFLFSRLFTHRRIDRTSLPATHFFSTEAELEESCIEDGRDTDKAELTGTLLKRYGFSNAHISKVSTLQPQIFNSIHPEKTILPKLDFYCDTVGFSNTDLPRFICSNPSLLTRNLQNQIVPCYSFIKNLLLSDDEIVLNTLKRSPRILTYSVDKRIAPNIGTLRAAGVPQKRILYLMRQGPSVLVSASLRESIKRATEMGLDPNKLSFVDAIRVFTELSDSTWDKKMEVYRKCGLSDAQILKAFSLHPKCMSLSEENIVQTMDFVVKKMGWQPVDLALNPTVLNYSLEKRTIPRCRVVRYLQGKGLLRKSISLGSFLLKKEKDFIDKFVKKYEADVPDLMDIYLGKTTIPPQEPIP